MIEKDQHTNYDDIETWEKVFIVFIPILICIFTAQKINYINSMKSINQSPPSQPISTASLTLHQ
jgi:hypothetical protein